jgi:signal transduction histidine kinase
MQSKRLAHWLQDHIEMLGNIEGEKDNTLYVVLYEGVMDMALNGETRMVDSVLESAAAHTVAVGRMLTDLLGVPQLLRERVWQRIGEEIDPEPAFVMLSALDAIFVHIFQVTIEAYLETAKLAMAAKSTEISRLYAKSEQKVMEYATEVSRANRELARLEQAKTDFISIAAHELKTPLTLIQGYVNFLLDLEVEGQIASLIQGINRGANRMNTIIEDMLDLSAMDMKKLRLVLQKVRLESTIDLTTVQLKRAIDERGQTITTAKLDTLPEIEADARRLFQIFKQLINNAVKYTPDGGHITITGREIEARRSRPGCVEIAINDTGVGIAPEDKEKIFEKFYRTGDSSLHSTSQTKFMGAGPGLGLAIVKGLVEAHNGHITVDSPGFDMQNFPGSTFRVVLPIQANPQPGINAQWISTEKSDTQQFPV